MFLSWKENFYLFIYLLFIYFYFIQSYHEDGFTGVLLQSNNRMQLLMNVFKLRNVEFFCTVWKYLKFHDFMIDCQNKNTSIFIILITTICKRGSQL